MVSWSREPFSGWNHILGGWMRTARHVWGLLQGHRTDGLDSSAIWVYRSRIGRRKFSTTQYIHWTIISIHSFLESNEKRPTSFNLMHDKCKFIFIIRRIWLFQQQQNRVHKILLGLFIHIRELDYGKALLVDYMQKFPLLWDGSRYQIGWIFEKL